MLLARCQAEVVEIDILPLVNYLRVLLPSIFRWHVLSAHTSLKARPPALITNVPALLLPPIVDAVEGAHRKSSNEQLVPFAAPLSSQPISRSEFYAVA